MAEPNQNPVICRNGHQQPVSNSKFCIYCGIPLTAPPTLQNQPPANQPPNQNPYQQNPQNQVQHQESIHVAQIEQQQQTVQQQQVNHNYHQQNHHQNPQHYQQPPPQNLQRPPVQVVQFLTCYTCGGGGQNLSEKTIICKECRWLRPLIPGYTFDSRAFEWAADGKAMAALRAITPLNAVAKSVSEKVGRRWIESTFNGVLLGEKQLPHIYAQAVKAARILGMSHMPDIYLSGERSWDCLTFGTDRDSFVVIGSALASSFQGNDLLFLLAREMGHCRAGHALWKSVIRFFLGEQGPAKGFMAGGIFNAILSPTALISSAIELPLLAWARQAEITADRAGLLTVGDEETARRVLLIWSLKSAHIYKQINIETWLEQQSVDDGGYSKLSELTTTSTPYITPRLKLLNEFAKSQELQYWRRMITNAIKTATPPPQPLPPPMANPPVRADAINLKCATCQTPMRVPLKVLEGKKELPVKCPECGKITRLTKKNNAAQQPPKNQSLKINKQENMDYGD